MNKYYLLFSFLLSFSTHLFAGNDKNSLGGRSAGMGNASVTFSDGFSVFANQAGLARLQTLDAGLYAENRFMLKDLGMYALAVGIPTKSSGTFWCGCVLFWQRCLQRTTSIVGLWAFVVQKNYLLGQLLSFVTIA
jgi:hypothetical protein